MSALGHKQTLEQAEWSERNVPHGNPARCLLCRLLLGPDGAIILRRHHDLYWIIVLAAFVLLEKSIPMGHWLGNLVGIALIAWGTAVLAGTLPLRFLGMA